MGIAYNSKIVTDGLVLCLDAANSKSYPGSGTTWKDLSGNGNHVTLINGVGYNNANNGSMVFDGVDDYMSNITIMNTNGQLTCEVGLYYNNKGTYHNIFDRYGSNPMLWLRSDNKIELSTGSGLVSTNTYQNQNIIITAVYNSISSPGLQLYINGNLVNTNTNIHGTWPAVPTYTLFNRNNGETFKGKIYFLKFYNRALSSVEIQQNFNATKSRYGL